MRLRNRTEHLAQLAKLTNPFMLVQPLRTLYSIKPTGLVSRLAAPKPSTEEPRFLLWPATIMNLCFAIFIPWFANMHTECSEAVSASGVCNRVEVLYRGRASGLESG